MDLELLKFWAVLGEPEGSAHVTGAELPSQAGGSGSVSLFMRAVSAAALSDVVQGHITNLCCLAVTDLCQEHG